jgi:hypothetical protein
MHLHLNKIGKQDVFVNISIYIFIMIYQKKCQINKGFGDKLNGIFGIFRDVLMMLAEVTAGQKCIYYLLCSFLNYRNQKNTIEINQLIYFSFRPGLLLKKASQLPNFF